MSHFILIRHLLKSIALLATVLTIAVACGGGGGGGAVVTKPLYTGKTTAALITDSNKEELVDKTLLAADTAGLNPLAAVTSSAEPVSRTPALPGLISTLSRVAGQLDFSVGEASALSAAGAIVTYNEPNIPGDCGGNMSLAMSVDDTTGDFDATVNFSSFNDCDGLINGQASMTGRFNQNDEPVSVKLSFGLLSFNDGVDSITMNGYIQIDMNADGSSTSAMEMDFRDNAENKVYRVNYTVNTSYNVSTVTMSITGRFYHPDYGYVDVSTPTTLSIGMADDAPSSGQLLVRGDAGSKVRVTFQSGGSYLLEGDLDGDGVYESMETCTTDGSCSALVS